jgi:hypothetical protein
VPMCRCLMLPTIMHVITQLPVTDALLHMMCALLHWLAYLVVLQYAPAHSASCLRLWMGAQRLCPAVCGWSGPFGLLFTTRQDTLPQGYPENDGTPAVLAGCSLQVTFKTLTTPD